MSIFIIMLTILILIGGCMYSSYFWGAAFFIFVYLCFLGGVFAMAEEEDENREKANDNDRIQASIRKIS